MFRGGDEVEVWNRVLTENPCENPRDETLRSFADASARRYRARLVPHEDRRAAGTDWRVAAAFETEEGEWLGSVVLPEGVIPSELSERELQRLLGQATRGE